MALSRKRKKPNVSSSAQAETPQVAPAGAETAQSESYNWRPVLQIGENTRQFYANYLEVNTTTFEMIVTFGQIPARFNLDDMERISRGEIVPLISNAQVTIPIAFVPYLLQTLADAKDTYDKMWGTRFAGSGEHKSDE